MNFTKKDLKLGMCFSKPLFFDDGRNVFLDAKQPITFFHIKCFDDWPVGFVVSDGEIFQSVAELKPNDDDFEELTPIDFVDEKKSDAFKNYEQILSELVPIFDAFSRGDYKFVQIATNSVSSKILKLATDNFDEIFPILLTERNKALNMAFFSVAIAKNLRFAENKILLCIKGSLFCDVSLLKNSDLCKKKSSEFNVSEKLIFENHPLESSEILKTCFKNDTEIALIALLHHQRLDGSGFPKNVLKGEVPDFVSVVSVAEVFENYISQKMSVDEAMKKLLSESGTVFDSKVVKSLAKVVEMRK